jgi:hypothetical protein
MFATALTCPACLPLRWHSLHVCHCADMPYMFATALTFPTYLPLRWHALHSASFELFCSPPVCGAINMHLAFLPTVLKWQISYIKKRFLGRLHFLEITSSNIGPWLAVSCLVFRDKSQVAHQISPCPLPSNFFSVHYSLPILRKEFFSSPSCADRLWS